MKLGNALGAVLLLGCNGTPAAPIPDDASADARAHADATLSGDARPDDDATPDDDSGGAADSDAPDGIRDADGDRDAGAIAEAGPDGCVSGEIVPDAGDTCVGFGTGDSCSTACGLPPYGYVCTNGGPPGFAGCVRVSNSALLGGTYCCPDLQCVRVTSQDNACADAGLGPRLYQCATQTDGGLLAKPAQGCTELGGLPSYRYFCCAS